MAHISKDSQCAKITRMDIGHVTAPYKLSYYYYYYLLNIFQATLELAVSATEVFNETVGDCWSSIFNLD